MDRSALRLQQALDHGIEHFFFFFIMKLQDQAQCASMLEKSLTVAFSNALGHPFQDAEDLPVLGTQHGRRRRFRLHERIVRSENKFFFDLEVTLKRCGQLRQRSGGSIEIMGTDLTACARKQQVA